MRDELGSWKIICTALRVGRSCRRDNCAISRFSRHIWPWSGRTSRTMHCPMVDFPDPDSPTRPKVSPFRRSKLTSVTARTGSPPRFRAGNTLVNERTSRSGSDMTHLRCGGDLLPAHATYLLNFRHRLEFGLDAIANPLDMLTASRMKPAAWGRACGTGHDTRNGCQWRRCSVCRNSGCGSQQSLRIGMLRSLQNGLHRTRLYNSSRIHHYDVVSNLAYYA
ncbi:protein of unknown function (plasmid) [Shinella sp. WSC3-e]|nr:protein of unknown function [Shinella sp. WSC3-e]